MSQRLSTFGTDGMHTTVSSSRHSLEKSIAASGDGVKRSSTPAAFNTYRKWGYLRSSTTGTTGPGSYAPTYKPVERRLSGGTISAPRSIPTVFESGQMIYIVRSPSTNPDQIGSRKSVSQAGRQRGSVTESSLVSPRTNVESVVNGAGRSASITDVPFSRSSSEYNGNRFRSSSVATDTRGGRLSQLGRDSVTPGALACGILHYRTSSVGVVPPIGTYELPQPRPTGFSFSRARHSVCESIPMSDQNTSVAKERDGSARLSRTTSGKSNNQKGSPRVSRTSPRPSSSISAAQKPRTWFNTKEGTLVYGCPTPYETPGFGAYMPREESSYSSKKNSTTQKNASVPTLYYRPRVIHYGVKTGAQHLEPGVYYSSNAHTAFKTHSHNAKLTREKKVPRSVLYDSNRRS